MIYDNSSRKICKIFLLSYKVPFAKCKIGKKHTSAPVWALKIDLLLNLFITQHINFKYIRSIYKKYFSSSVLDIKYNLIKVNLNFSNISNILYDLKIRIWISHTRKTWNFEFLYGVLFPFKTIISKIDLKFTWTMMIQLKKSKR